MKFLIAIHHPDGYDGSQEPPEMGKAIDDLNDKMVAAGVRVFVGGLHPAHQAKSVRATEEGQVEVTTGPWLKTSEHVGGLWVLDCASEEEAVAWAGKAARACRAPVEIRQFH